MLRPAIATAVILILFLSVVPVSAVERVNEGFLPEGPFVKTLRFQFYENQAAVIDALRAGSLDLMDFRGLSPEVVAEFLPNPDIAVTPPLTIFGMFELDVNMLGDRWAEWGGCDFDHGNSFCGIQIRKALSHLIDKAEFIQAHFPGLGVPIDVPASPAQIGGSINPGRAHLWDTFHQPLIGAFNVAPDPGGFPSPGSPDFCAARDHLVAAGIGLVDANDDCVIDNAPAGMVANPIRVMTRSDDVFRRKPLGEGIVSATNALMGATVAEAVLGTPSEIVFPIVLDLSVLGDWELYTGGWGGGLFAQPFAIYGRHATPEVSELCGPLTGTFLNFAFVCVETMDSHFEAALEAETMADFDAATQNGYDEFGKRAITIPVFSAADRFAYLNMASGVVDEVGSSSDNFWTLLNIRENPDFTPTNPIYDFGGGDRKTVRVGRSFPSFSLNTFVPRGISSESVLREIYDTLLRTDPTDPSKIFPWMAEHFEVINDPNQPSLGYAPPEGAAQTIRFKIRSKIEWHDGERLTAQDAKFSLLNFRDLSGFLTPNLIDVIVLNKKRFDVHFADKSLLNVYDAGLGRIIPMHIWGLAGDTTYDDVPIVDPAKIDPSYDPLVAGTLIGSGPFLCKSLDKPRRTGGGCAFHEDDSPAGGFLGAGDTLILRRYGQYHALP